MSAVTLLRRCWKDASFQTKSQLAPTQLLLYPCEKETEPVCWAPETVKLKPGHL